MRLPSKSGSFWLLLIAAGVVVAFVSGGDSDDDGERGGGAHAVRAGKGHRGADPGRGGRDRGRRDGHDGRDTGRDRESAGHGGSSTSPADRGATRSPTIPDAARRVTVTDVADGDTIDLAGLGSSRLIGIDTPEVYFGAECFGARASAFTKRELPPGTAVYYLHGAERTDRYDRDLVYVWLPGGTFFNALLAKRGYAVPLTITPNVEFADLFDRLADAARTAGRGLWAARTCGGDPDLPVDGNG